MSLRDRYYVTFVTACALQPASRKIAPKVRSEIGVHCNQAVGKDSDYNQAFGKDSAFILIHLPCEKGSFNLTHARNSCTKVLAHGRQRHHCLMLKTPSSKVLVEVSPPTACLSRLELVLPGDSAKRAWNGLRQSLKINPKPKIISPKP